MSTLLPILWLIQKHYRSYTSINVMQYSWCIIWPGIAHSITLHNYWLINTRCVGMLSASALTLMRCCVSVHLHSPWCAVVYLWVHFLSVPFLVMLYDAMNKSHQEPFSVDSVESPTMKHYQTAEYSIKWQSEHEYSFTVLISSPFNSFKLAIKRVDLSLF